MTERSIIRRIRGMDTSDGAGVKLKRIIGQPGLDMVDPFLLLDEFRSDQAGDYIAGFPEHPHRGFETVTYMLAGHMQHGDNHGNRGDLTPGSVQWMTAGRGILHSEMPQQENGLMWGFQLWVNLPAKDKMTEPRYQDIGPERIPTAQPTDGVSVKVIAGDVFGVSGPVSGIVTAPVYLDISVEAGAQVEVPLPEGHSAFAYVFEGTDAQVAGEALKRSDLAVLSKGDSVRIAGRDGAARVLLVAGKPLNESVARYGPFVMNTPEQIHEAIQDFRAGKF
ncbi:MULTISPECIES: pirin family protein [Dyella]|uniref:Pirin family protein n=2 Tax=Dyella TaxID=231454 RepID=A0A4R0YTV6_9GAMM|nr:MULTISPECIES: pirin family protein [Dyella]TBR35905.1 pirin family protein [Dyella terrae]TCI08547.1 pirin family protein [Dyella soli]